MNVATEKFEMPITVDNSHIDQLGHVNNTVYLKWVQEAATAHWMSRTTDAEKQTWYWVVTRHEIDYKYPAFLGEVLKAVTWVGKAKELRYERFTEIRRVKDDALLARARTEWCPIDTQTFRPRAVSEAVREKFSTG